MGSANEVHFVLRCSQMWPKKVKECGVLRVSPCSPPRALEDSHSGTGVVAMEDMIAILPPNISRSHRRGYLHFASGEKVSGERMKQANDPVEMALERYDGD
ncbi:unnamed protein product [Pleuronectes platessa]|uniref:Uncharacterized protein n=1 Tax=Pleuronectes platessa TaxID=8262 RepID=A0A9N7UZV5_PLEPL|nr:unnamed protein product [Pleuronectes platessa]